MNGPLTRIAVAGCSALAVGLAVAPGADAAPAATVASQATRAEQGAVNWGKARLGQDIYEGYCLGFVVDAYNHGGGVNIGSAGSAVEYWSAHADRQHPTDVNPPYGALVFWGATSANPYGHVGISLGDGTVISSYEESTHTIHVFSITTRNNAGYPYLGWMQMA